MWLTIIARAPRLARLTYLAPRAEIERSPSDVFGCPVDVLRMSFRPPAPSFPRLHGPCEPRPLKQAITGCPRLGPESHTALPPLGRVRGVATMSRRRVWRSYGSGKHALGRPGKGRGA